ncbi:ABC transporter permease [Planobispora takensis]|uniref:Membrane protein n=1 Tax=Planobispora takensis TaxID=1367882 RepID=A0A8J3T331_9ACTN|nr:ABC transporter permease [Planobispora takensis]GII03165.1 membrane protein [Planobispora takensis]
MSDLPASPPGGPVNPVPHGSGPRGPAGPVGVIHDIGYRHYDGPRLGRGPATVALAVHTLRGVFGLGRPARSKIIPFALFGIMMLPAVVSIAVMAMVQQRAMEYTPYATIMQPVLAIFLASQSPYAVAPDLRFRVLPLYLSRPVGLWDYVGAKLAAMAVAMFTLLAVPLTVLYVGELLVDMPGPPQTSEYLAGMAGAVGYAVLLASLGVAIASFTPRRGLGVASVIALYLLASGVSTVVAAVMESVNDYAAAGWAWLINPFFLVDAAIPVGLFGTEPAAPGAYPTGVGVAAAIVLMLALIALSMVALIARYRKAASR